MGRLLTASQAAPRFRVHRTTVLYWHSHGWRDPNTGQLRSLSTVLDPVTGELMTDPRTGARLFDEAELVVAEQQTRAKAQRSHRRSRQFAAA